MGKIRTFIAVKVSQRVNNNVGKVVRRLAALCDQYRWVELENQLVGLNYVGEVIDVEVPELCKLIKDAIEPFESFEMSLQGVDGFSSAQEPRTLWIGVDEGREQKFRNCVSFIRRWKPFTNQTFDVLHHWGVNKDRNDYIPHMTLGKLSRGGRWNDETVRISS